MLDASEINPTEFWKILNSLKEKSEDPSTSISPQDWFAYFKDLMNKNYASNYSVNDSCKYLHCNNDQLNSDITAEEMMNAVKHLENKKASGLDCISIEMIKASSSILPNLYVDIFNTILRSGVFPSLWRENFIKPLFKGGDMNDPSCYRGIAISSCLSKLFTRIMFNRLDEYLENNNIICPEQKGFRKGMRTSDHIFTLKTLIDKYFKKNKYIFACFIDLKKAFDTVNRNTLLHKICQCNIRGNLFSVLESMYKKVSFSVDLP